MLNTPLQMILVELAGRVNQQQRAVIDAWGNSCGYITVERQSDHVL